MFAKLKKEIDEEVRMEIMNGKIEDVQLEIEESKKQVETVIVNTLERGDQLSDLENKTKDLIHAADMFRKRSKKVKRKFCCKEYKGKILILFMILCIIIFICVLIYYEYH